MRLEVFAAVKISVMHHLTWVCCYRKVTQHSSMYASVVDRRNICLQMPL
jgi:REP element-mobilizing transposase RayT